MAATSGDISKSSKLILFSSLTLIITANIVFMNLSRSNVDKQSLYYSSTSVFIVEIMKIVLSLILLLYNLSFNFVVFKKTLFNEIVVKWQNTLMLSVPAIVYVIQNNLSFFALGNLDPATYQVTYQIKLLTTALVMRLMLGKVLKYTQWFALFILLAGVTMVELEKLSVSSNRQAPEKSANLPEATVGGLSSSSYNLNVVWGIAATIGMTFCSAFAGVYFEKMVKQKQPTSSSPSSIKSSPELTELSLLWIKNIQLYLFSCASALFGCFLQDGEKIMLNGFFHGYNRLTILVILISSGGGIATALMVKYLDNIYKNFASSMSIVFASASAFVFSGQHYGLQFFCGSLLVCFSLFVYQYQPSASFPSSSSSIRRKNSSNRKDMSHSVPMYIPGNVNKASGNNPSHV